MTCWPLCFCKQLPGVQTRVLESNKEFCMWGRHVMMGYMKMPEKTAEAVDSEGWLHSGDIADVDVDGFWKITGRWERGSSPASYCVLSVGRITFIVAHNTHFPAITLTLSSGRIKELIITAGGENIPPVLIEDQFKSALPALSNAMLVGDKKKFLAILFCLKTVHDQDGLPTSKLAKEVVDIGASFGSKATTVEEVIADPLWKKYLDDGMKRANSQATSNAQKVQKYTILPVDFSEKGGELTPTLKLKRSEVIKKYANVIDNLYAGSD